MLSNYHVMDTWSSYPSKDIYLDMHGSVSPPERVWRNFLQKTI